MVNRQHICSIYFERTGYPIYARARTHAFIIGRKTHKTFAAIGIKLLCNRYTNARERKPHMSIPTYTFTFYSRFMDYTHWRQISHNSAMCVHALRRSPCHVDLRETSKNWFNVLARTLRTHKLSTVYSYIGTACANGPFAAHRLSYTYCCSIYGGHIFV